MPLDPTRAVALYECLPCQCLWSCDARVATLDAVGPLGQRFSVAVAFNEPGGTAVREGDAGRLAPSEFSHVFLV